MKTPIILLFVINLTSNCLLADDTECRNMDYEARVIAENGLKIRNYPSIDSPAIAGVPFWGKVEVCNVPQGEDTIDNITASWRKVKYGKIEGYMFEAYLTRVDSMVEKSKDFRIMKEGDPCGVVNYDPSLYWYGVFRTPAGDSLLKVNVKFSVGMNEFGSHGSFITTDRSGKYETLFLIGSKIVLKEKVVSYNNITPPRFLYPGDRYLLYAWEHIGKALNLLVLNAIGTVKDVRYCPEFEDYRLRLSDEMNDYQTQDLTDDFTYFGECNFVQIEWFGDIDDDLKPDLLFSASSNYVNRITLFLSITAMEGKFVRKADEWTMYDCC